jgi:hypothetical protein
MSRLLALAARSRTRGILVCGLAVAPMAACHQRSSIPGRPSSPEKVNVGYGQQSREQTGGAMAEEVAESRLCAGIHYRFDKDAGLDIARRVTALALARGVESID